MKKDIAVNFLKDKLNMIIMFSINTLVLILFFNVAPGRKKEILYPLILAAFSFVIMLIIEWYKYYEFNINLMQAKENLNYDLHPKTKEQKQVCEFIKRAHNRSVIDTDERLSQYQNNKIFLSQWIHNLKTPISVINLIIEKLKLDNNYVTEAIEEISLQNRRLYEGIENILNISRLENFAKDYIPASADLVSSLKRVINQRKNQFILSNVFPKFEGDLESAYVLTDLKWNEVLIDQIISNSIKYSRGKDANKNIYIKIKVDNKVTSLSIRDEGIGIPSYDLKKVFEPFFTGENGRKVKGSTGIGLYVCSEIAKKLGHEITINSEEGKGTEVIIKYVTKL